MIVDKMRGAENKFWLILMVVAVAGILFLMEFISSGLTRDVIQAQTGAIPANK